MNSNLILRRHNDIIHNQQKISLVTKIVSSYIMCICAYYNPGFVYIYIYMYIYICRFMGKEEIYREKLQSAYNT